MPYWIVIEALPTKLPQYALPIYPAVILALAWALEEGLLAAPFERRWQRWLEWLTLAGHVVATLALAALAAALPIWLGGIGLLGRARRGGRRARHRRLCFGAAADGGRQRPSAARRAARS